ncbi:D-glycero-beta-D-manno-heptose 1,7-bisphosphate 7-phosphatase [Legionella dresdenensis]|uniref:D,D-heptose 1,7-bisphosphate phosphatase n=1 Tax=Legionella dresdenensis TaxID=450200 RepID=A0ABV8CIB5_9GAMM
MKKVILLDRDGVINQDSLHYIKSVDEFIVLPGSIAAIARLTQAGYVIGVATNQSGITRGLYTADELAAIHNKLINLVEQAGGRIDAIEFCPHLPETGCGCRKPAPGMLMALAKRFGRADLTDVYFVGDRVSDIEAAQAAGASPILVLSPMTDRVALLKHQDVPVFRSLAEWVDSLLAEPC